MTLIQFDDGSGRRIGSAVRFVEELAGKRKPLLFDRVSVDGTPYRLSVATFTGSWATGTWKTVTLINSTNTASVYNWCNAAEGGGHVVFGKASGTNSAVEITMAATANTSTANTSCFLTLGGVDLSTIAGYSSTDIQLLGHNTTGPCLEWYSVTTCSTSTAA